LIQTIVKK